MSARIVASDIMMIGCELGSLSLMLQVPKPSVQIKDMILTRLRLETTLWYTGL